MEQSPTKAPWCPPTSPVGVLCTVIATRRDGPGTTLTRRLSYGHGLLVTSQLDPLLFLKRTTSQCMLDNLHKQCPVYDQYE